MSLSRALAYGMLQTDRPSLSHSFALACCAVVAVFSWQGLDGLNLADEGFLWYGVQRVMQGEVPFRDFMSYDPGRYYWSAALMTAWGSDGILALRSVLAVTQVCALTVGLHLLVRDCKRLSLPWFLLLCFVLVTWMFPRHKLFDAAVSIFLIALLSHLLGKPSRATYFLTGVGVGLIAFVGRNHGLYGAFGSILAIIWLHIGDRKESGLPRAVLLWAGGLSVGMLPLFTMILAVPGFGAALGAWLEFTIQSKATNIGLPIPWPWNADFGLISHADALRYVLRGMFFMAILAFGVWAPCYAFFRRLQGRFIAPTFAACAFLALPYAQYAFSRADSEHLAMGIFPALIAVSSRLTASNGVFRWTPAIVLAATGIFVGISSQPGWQCHFGHKCVQVDIAGSTLQLDPNTAWDIALLKSLVSRYASHGESFVVAPSWPAAYAIFGRKSPMWSIYSLFTRDSEFQDQEIAGIQRANPAFILLIDTPLDGRDDLRFRTMHGDIVRYIDQNFMRAPLDAGNADFLLFVPRHDKVP